MGFLRLLLAAAVVAEHSTPIFGLTFTGGHMAVRLFFIISGFYMALILTTKYTCDTPSRYRLFITNRWLRIYPSYWAILAISILFYAAASVHLHKPADRLMLWHTAWANGEGLKLVLIGLANLLIVGLDTVCFFVFDLARGIHWPSSGNLGSTAWLPTTASDTSGAVPAWRFLFVPQAWSISIELLFYLIAPWLISWRTRSLVILGSASAALFFAAKYAVPPAVFSLGYFFFPFHIVLFVIGMLSYRYSERIVQLVPNRVKWAFVAIMFGLILGYQFIEIQGRDVICIVMVALALPMLFFATKDSRVNKWVGDLSYPIYVSHIFLKWVLLALMGVSKVGTTSPPGWLLLMISIAAAAILLYAVDRPIDRWRQRRVRRDNRLPTDVLTEAASSRA